MHEQRASPPATEHVSPATQSRTSSLLPPVGSQRRTAPPSQNVAAGVQTRGRHVPLSQNSVDVQSAAPVQGATTRVFAHVGPAGPSTHSSGAVQYAWSVPRLPHESKRKISVA